MNPSWTIISNTDAVDIDQKCLGLDAGRSSIPDDVAEHIHRNRGLHIQIRHNGDPKTFRQASDLVYLIHASPLLLHALKELLQAYKKGLDCWVSDCGCEGNEEPKRLVAQADAVIRQAEGRAL